MNRLGQHYAIVPEDPAKWGSVLKPSRFWDFWYLYSAYHLEHHYFTGVPFYNLRKLHFALRPFFESIELAAHDLQPAVQGLDLSEQDPPLRLEL